MLVNGTSDDANLAAGDKEALAEEFKEMDANGDGKITKQELVSFMSKKTKCDDLKQFENLFESVDYDGDGSLSYEELMMVAVNRKLMQKEERLWEVFSEIDVNNDGDVCPPFLLIILVHCRRCRLVSSARLLLLFLISCFCDTQVSIEEIAKALQIPLDDAKEMIKDVDTNNVRCARSGDVSD